MSDSEQGGDGAEGGGVVADVAGAASGGLEQLSGALGEGEDTADARAGLDATAQAANAVGDGARMVEGGQNMVEGFESGEFGDGFAGMGSMTGGGADMVGSVSDGLSNVIDDPEARRTLGEVSRTARQVGAVARQVGQALDQAVDFISNLIGEQSDVDYRVAIADIDDEISVVELSLREPLSELYECHVSAFTSAHLSQSELLGKDVLVSIERGSEQRSVRGIISTATVERGHGEGADGYDVALEIVPAVHLMAHTVDSRVYQDTSVPDLVETLVDELCGSRSRKVNKDDLTQSYPAHEYLVQHNESHIEFLERLCAEEGIFFYFDHDAEDEDHEVLVLADSNDNRPRIREAFEGRVQYTGGGEQAARHEVATAVDRRERIGATDSVVSGYDWSNPAMRVKQERAGRGTWSGPALEKHDHFAHVRHHGYDDGGGQYRGHSAERRARMNTERLDIERQSWTITTTVVSASPGRTFTLEGTDDHDGEYLIVGVTAQGANGASGLGNYTNSLRVIPKSMPFRPAMPRRRSMPGPETATVVGPAGEEIHTDRHGRIKVQFHWDRRGRNDDRSSAWIRVAQTWAGPGFGTIFIPRVGMEVLVQFLGGDPDRPIVTGCIYNGDNAPPYSLPDEKTKSTIKTNSSTGGGGYNELRFEDKKGSEEVFLHAERDFNEVVERNHSTSVKGNQSNSVSGNQSETIKKNQTQIVQKDQTITVEGSRTKVVKTNETTTVKADRARYVVGNENISVNAHQNTLIKKGNRSVTTEQGMQTFVSKGAFTITQNDDHKIGLRDGIVIATQAVLDMNGVAGTSIQSDKLVVATVGASSITMTATGIVISSPNITLISAAPVNVVPSVKTPTVIYSGASASGQASAHVDADGDGTSDAEEGDGLTAQEQAEYDRARCARASYGDDSPEGFHIARNDDGSPWIRDEESGMRAVLYQSDTDPSRYILAYAGTSPDLDQSTVDDGVVDVQQGIGMQTQHWDDSARAADDAAAYVDEHGGTLEMTGHSLGGGEAALNGMRHNVPTTTFNAAGVHNNTMQQYGVENHSQDNITNYSAPLDPLTAAQESDGFTGAAMPDAAGRQRTVIPRDDDGSVGWTANHGMNEVENGMEQPTTWDRRRGTWY
jgi:type VI secretion system secreted protein VgrG